MQLLHPRTEGITENASLQALHRQSLYKLEKSGTPEQILRTLKEVTGTQLAFIFIFDKEQETRSFYEGCRLKEEFEIRPSLFQGRSIVEIADISKDHDLKENQGAKVPSYFRSLLSSPIPGGSGTPMGAIGVIDHLPGHFEEKDRLLLEEEVGQFMTHLEEELKEELQREDPPFLTERVLDQDEKRRSNTGMHLHERIARRSTAIQMHFGALKKDLNEDSKERLREEIVHFDNALDEAVQETRSISRKLTLRPSPGGPLKTIEKLILLHLGEGSGKKLSFHHDIQDQVFPTFIEQNLYRIVQEILEFVHGSPEGSYFKMQLSLKRRSLELSLNGPIKQGYKLGQQDHLERIRERVNALGGGYKGEENGSEDSKRILEFKIPSTAPSLRREKN